MNAKPKLTEKPITVRRAPPRAAGTASTHRFLVPPHRSGSAKARTDCFSWAFGSGGAFGRRLDPALIRPGRVDVLEYVGLASHEQATPGARARTRARTAPHGQ